MSDSPNQRLRDFISSIDDSYEDIADKTGYSRRTWQRQVEEGASIKSDYLLKLREIYGADIAYILTGEKSVHTPAHSDREPVYENRVEPNPIKEPLHAYKEGQSVTTLSQNKESDERDWDPDEFVTVPFYPNVYASGGQGLITQNERSLPITFRCYFFTNTIFASAKDCFMIRIKGDSMHPIYPDGSDLLVDQARTKIKEGPGFIVRIEDTLYCKLLSKVPGGNLKMRSINEDYQEVELDPKAQGFEIIGEVVWHAQKSKYI